MVYVLKKVKQLELELEEEQEQEQEVDLKVEDNEVQPIRIYKKSDMIFYMYIYK